MTQLIYNKLLILCLVFGITTGLDVSLEKVVCDSTLPVTADLYMQCENATGARCTFGNTAILYGTLHYNNVENSGIQDNQAYMSANLNLWTLSFNLLDMVPLSLCSDAIVATEDNQYACPGTGSYDFSVDYALPSAGSNTTSWLATGWHGEGLIQMYAESDETMKIGECKLELQTYVTPKEMNNTMMQVPSAAVSSGLLLALLAIIALIFFYCYCCMRSRRARNKPTEEVTYYKQMEDGKSSRSRGSSKKSKRTVIDDDSIVTDPM